MSKLATFTWCNTGRSTDEFFVNSKFTRGEDMYSFTDTRNVVVAAAIGTWDHFEVRVRTGIRVRRTDDKAYHIPVAIVSSLDAKTAFGKPWHGEESVWRSRFAEKLQMREESYVQLVNTLAGRDLHEVFRAVNDWSKHVVKSTDVFQVELANFQHGLSGGRHKLYTSVLDTWGEMTPKSHPTHQPRLNLCGTDTDKACIYTLPKPLATNSSTHPAILVELRKDSSQLVTSKLVTLRDPAFPLSVTASTASSGTNSILPWIANDPRGIRAALERNHEEVVEAQMT